LLGLGARQLNLINRHHLGVLPNRLADQLHMAQIVQGARDLAVSARVIGHVEDVTHNILGLNLRGQVAIRRGLDLATGL
jgi:hypothetical protein